MVRRKEEPQFDAFAFAELQQRAKLLERRRPAGALKLEARICFRQQPENSLLAAEGKQVEVPLRTRAPLFEGIAARLPARQKIRAGTRLVRTALNEAASMPRVKYGRRRASGLRIASIASSVCGLASRLALKEKKSRPMTARFNGETRCACCSTALISPMVAPGKLRL
jgi:hypothetical protein